MVRNGSAAVAAFLLGISILCWCAGGEAARTCAFFMGMASAIAWLISAALPMYFLSTRTWIQVLLGLNCIAASATAGAVLTSVSVSPSQIVAPASIASPIA